MDTKCANLLKLFLCVQATYDFVYTVLLRILDTFPPNFLSCGDGLLYYRLGLGVYDGARLGPVTALARPLVPLKIAQVTFADLGVWQSRLLIVARTVPTFLSLPSVGARSASFMSRPRP